MSRSGWLWIGAAVVSVTLVYCFAYMGLVTVLAITAAIFAWNVQSLRVNNSQTFCKAVRHLFVIQFLNWLGYFMWKRFERRTKNIQKIQSEMLLKQLKINAETEYGKKYNFSTFTSPEEYIRGHPLTRYSHFEPYIDRMEKGETNILTHTQPHIFGVTSGTSGKSNVLPMVKGQGSVFFTDGIVIIYKHMIDAFPQTTKLQKGLKLFYNPRWRYNVSGIKIGPNSSTPANSKKLLHMYTTPTIAYDVLSEPEALYIYLLFALKERQLGMIEANFSSLIYNAFKTMQDKWELLLEDIEKGKLNPDLKIDNNIRKEIDELMKADVERVAELREARADGIVGLGRRIWPNASIAFGTDTGTFEFYGNNLRETYLKGIPLYSPIYAASEGLLGINIWPTQLPSRYVLVPTAQFFEFIPLEKSDEIQPDTLLMHQVELGKEYEIVITNLSCVYRYRFGDVVRVSGFLHQCPIIEFRYRQGQFLNVRGEKTSEAAFYSALSEAVSKWPNVKLKDYSCAESIYIYDSNVVQDETSIPYYHVFLELENTSDDESVSIVTVTEEHRQMIDEMLCFQSYVYSSFRKKGSIGRMKVHFVKAGTFGDFRQFMIQTTSVSSVQFKVPRVLKRKEAVKFMFEHILL